MSRGPVTFAKPENALKRSVCPLDALALFVPPAFMNHALRGPRFDSIASFAAAGGIDCRGPEASSSPGSARCRRLKSTPLFVALHCPFVLPLTLALVENPDPQKHKNWQKSLEKVMFKFVECVPSLAGPIKHSFPCQGHDDDTNWGIGGTRRLCVEMKKGRQAKDGLINYRNACANVNTNSLEEVIKYLVRLASEKADEAQQEAQLQDISDLEAQHTPEALLNSYDSDDTAKDQLERGNEAFKFLWETYRMVLEILKNNSKLEGLYAMTAQKAFNFCLQYRRAMEFRRLADMLRNHLSILIRFPRDENKRVDKSDPSQPETFQLLLEVRFDQLNAATELQQWQEAFRSVEDIHGLMTHVRRTPKPQLMAVYYAKLTQIFWMSNNLIHHAYAWYKLFNLARTHNKNLTDADSKALASAVLLAAVAVPPYDPKGGSPRMEQESDKERNVRMAQLLGFAPDPTRDTRDALSRAALLNQLAAKGFHSLVHDEVRQLADLLEGDFNPLEFCSRAEELLAKLEHLPDELSPNAPVSSIDWKGYTATLRKVMVLRFLQQASSVYLTMRLRSLEQLVPSMSLEELEAIIAEAVRNGFVNLRIDHAKGCMRFGQVELESEHMRGHLAQLARRLSRAVKMIEPTEQKPDLPEDLTQQVEDEHKKALARKTYIERRKQEQERQAVEQQQQEEQKRQEMLRATEEAEARRLEEERKQREEERIRKEIEEREKEEARQLLQEKAKRMGKKPKVEKEQLDKRQLMQDALQEQIRERQDMEKKLNKLAKQLDHFERAKREEEAPLIEEHYRKMLERDQEYLQRIQAEQEAQHRRAWELDLQEKHRLARVEQDRLAYADSLLQSRRSKYEQALASHRQRASEIRSERHRDRLNRRRSEWLHRLREAEESLKERERERKREEERRRREQEEEERRRMERENARPRPSPPASSQREGGGAFRPPHRRKGFGFHDEPAPTPQESSSQGRGFATRVGREGLESRFERDRSERRSRE